MKHKKLWAVLGAVLVTIGLTAAVQAQSTGGPRWEPGRLHVDDQAPLVKFRILDGSAVRWKLDAITYSVCDASDCVAWYPTSLISWRTTRNVEFRRDTLVDGADGGGGYQDHAYVLTVEVDGELYQYKYPVAGRVELVSELPVAGDDVATTIAGRAVEIDVLANDVWEQGEDPRPEPAFEWEGNSFGHYARHGTTTTGDDGTITYTPDPGFVGTDTFSYSLPGDAFGTSDFRSNVVATVTVTVTAAPPPTKTVSFVGGSATVARDTPFVEQLQAEGYTVTRYDDSTVSASQVDGTVVVISSSVEPAIAGSLAAQLDEPVVTWEPYVADELGMVTTPSANKVLTAREVRTPWPAGSPSYLTPATIRVVDPFHPVVADAMQIEYDVDGFEVPVLRPLSSATADTPWSVIDERYLPAGQDPAIARKGAPIVAGQPYGYGHVVVIDTTARVLLPWTYQTQHLLTADGWTLFLNSVEWAAARA